jgi:hypothetical protein
MVSIAGSARPRRPVPRWHRAFLAMLPKIAGHARIAFRYLNPDARAEAVQEVVCNALRAYVRLVQLKKTDQGLRRPVMPRGQQVHRAGPRSADRRAAHRRVPPEPGSRTARRAAVLTMLISGTSPHESDRVLRWNA